MLRLGIIALLLVSTAHGKPLISNLIEPASYFTGRSAELEKLNAHLSQYNTSSIVGLTGIGKSQLIRKYAFENRGKYKLIWFFDCSLSLDRQFANLAREINIKLDNSQNLLPENENAKQAILNYITSNRDTLIVLDNIKIGNNDIIQDFNKFEHNAHIIFCSQDSKDLPHAIRLANLSEVDASILFDKIIDKRSFQEKKILNNLLKGYPLLIVQAAFLLKDNEYLTVEDYRKTFSDQKKNIDDHINMVLQNLSLSAKELLYMLVLIDNSFSRDCINRISPGINIEKIQELIRFGLISDAGLINNIQIFELHDMIKNSLLNIVKQSNIVSCIESTIASIHNSLPKSSLYRYKLFLADNTLFNAIEKLEHNAILYKLNFFNILTLTRHRLVFYVFSRNKVAMNLIQEWFESYKDQTHLNQAHNILNKVSYSECIFMLGLNEFIFKPNIEKGYEHITNAQSIIENIAGEPYLKISIYGQLAQYYVDVGDLKTAEQNLQKMVSLKTQYPEEELSLRLYHLMAAKIHLNTAQYDAALKEIEYCLNQEKNKSLLNNTFFTGTFLLQARIFNRIENYQKAREIGLRIKNLPNFKSHDNALRALTFIELSVAELGLANDNHLALAYAEQANEILNNKKNKNNHILLSRDTYLADAIIARANALSAMGDFQKAIEDYLVAEVIYYNKYTLNIKYIDDVRYMYYNAAKAGKHMKANTWTTYFCNKHLKYFGPSNKKT